MLHCGSGGSIFSNQSAKSANSPHDVTLGFLSSILEPQVTKPVYDTSYINWIWDYGLDQICCQSTAVSMAAKDRTVVLSLLLCFILGSLSPALCKFIWMSCDQLCEQESNVYVCVCVCWCCRFPDRLLYEIQQEASAVSGDQGLQRTVSQGKLSHWSHHVRFSLRLTVNHWGLCSRWPSQHKWTLNIPTVEKQFKTSSEIHFYKLIKCSHFLFKHIIGLVS